MPRPNTIELAQSKGYLESMDVQCPEDASPASLASLASYIRRGNGVQGSTPEERIVLIQHAHDTWIGTRVAQGDVNGRQGIVKYLLAKVPQQVMAMRGGLRQSGIDARTRTSSPFRAGVLWDGEYQIRIIDLDGLMAIPNP